MVSAQGSSIDLSRNQASVILFISAGFSQVQYRLRMEAFCLRMLHKKCFIVSNRWYAPDLRVSKMAIVAKNVSVMEVVFFLGVKTCDTHQ